MNDERWKRLMGKECFGEENDEPDLTNEEFKQGWHYCYEWDGMLVGPGMEEMECCKCFKQNLQNQQSNDHTNRTRRE